MSVSRGFTGHLCEGGAVSVSLLEQINRVAGKSVRVIVAEDWRAELGIDRKTFYAQLERAARIVDMRAFVTGQDRPTGPLTILVSERREGLLVQLWELRG